MTKIFLTGTTGYIGGGVLDVLVKQHPEWQYTALLRNVPDEYKTRYPQVTIIKGNYDSSDILSNAASQADIVIHSGDSDHEPSIKALLAGLKSRKQKTFLIHLGGTGVLSDWKTGQTGELTPKIWSDVDDIDEIWSQPDYALHRNVDKIIQETAADKDSTVHTAIVCPPDIYGPSPGLSTRQSFFTPFYWEAARSIDRVFFAGSGSNTRSFVHLDDLLAVYLKVIEAAARGGEGADWGLQGYYFSSSQEYSMRELADAFGKLLKARNLLPTAEPKQLTVDELKGLLPGNFYGETLPLYIFGSNGRTRPDRAKKLFGYQPKSPSYLDVLGEDLTEATSRASGRLG